MDVVQLLLIFLPIFAGLCVRFVPALAARRARNVFTGAALVVTLALAVLLLSAGERYLLIWQMTDALPIALRTDGVSRLFLGLFAAIWTVVGFYSFDYMRHEENERGFYTFYLVSLGVLMGLTQSENIVTLYLFYEAMTLVTLPLVLHERTKEAVAAGLKYLIYSVFGASAALLGIFFLASYGVTLSFTAGGVLDAAKIAGHEGGLRVVAFLMIVGFGTKAGMFPMHGWLPTAHPVAPAPASAVLSGIITKAGVLGVLRTVFYLFGVDFLRGSWVQYAFMTLALVTVFLGSMLAFKEKVFKKRLAYSTVSQVSYVLFGLATMTRIGFVGALLHVVFHSVIKNNLFMGAGAVIEKTGKKLVSELTGIGQQMPWTIGCFTVASLGLIGIPPMCGFISKWYLAQGALSLGATVFAWMGPAVLLVSAILTAAYLLPVPIRGYFPGRDAQALPRAEASGMMLAPMLALSAATVLLGVFPTRLIAFFNGIVNAIL